MYQWNAIVNSVGEESFYWGIATYQNSASPTTGPYYSELHRCIFDENTIAIPSLNYAVSNVLDEGEEHWYKFNVSTNATYQVFTSGNVDTRGWLYETHCLNDTSSYYHNDDSGSGSNFLIEAYLFANYPGDAVYYIKVEGYNKSVSGSYSIEVSRKT